MDKDSPKLTIPSSRPQKMLQLQSQGPGEYNVPTPLTKTQQKMWFETICAGLIESWNADEGLCIEALMKFINFSVNYEIPNTQFTEPIANIIFQLLSTDHLLVVQKSLNLV